MSVIDSIRAKYAKTETISDTLGRIIVVRRLTLSQQAKVRQLAETSDITVVGMLSLAASVISIDGNPWPWRDRRDLDMLLDALDEVGLTAVGEAAARFLERPEAEQAADAKNSPPMEGSAPP